MNILITGATGFVGFNLSEYLIKNGHTLSALAQSRFSDTNKKYSEIYTWNELSKINFNTFDVIIHLAGKAHDTKNVAEEHVYFDINTELTKKIFDFFLESQVKQFIFFSSVKAVAGSINGELKEDYVPKPVGPYGKSKMKAEEYILSKVYPKEKSIYILRPCMIHGAGNKGNLNLLYRFVQKGIPYPLAAFENMRSFLSINNLCYIMNALIDTTIPSGIYNIADDKPVSTNELIILMASNLNKKPKMLKLPKAIFYVIARIGDFMHLPFDSQTLQKMTENYVVSNQKIKQHLNINLPISSHDGLRETFKSFNNV